MTLFKKMGFASLEHFWERRRLLGLGFLVAILATVLNACGGASTSAPQIVKPVVTSIVVSPADPGIQVNGSQQFTAAANYSDGSTTDISKTATWSSSDTSKVTVDSNGLAKGIAPGAAGITATFSGVGGTTGLGVALKSLGMTPTNQTIDRGATQQFKATATFGDNSTSNVTAWAKWSSSDTSIATIETAGQASPGLATGVKNGAVNLQASFGGSTALTILDVSSNNGTPTGVGLSEINPSIAPGAKLQFIAVLLFSDGSSQKITTAATWTSSDTSKLMVETVGDTSPGAALGVAATGSTPVTITASFQGLSQSTQVTVVGDAASIPLMDMTVSQDYLGFGGGLYENSSDSPPTDHDTAGKTAAAAIQPLDQTGKPSSKGAVVFLGIGMSNATLEFSAFLTAASSNSGVNQKTLAIEDGAYGAVTACAWTVAQGPTTPTCPEFTSGVPAENQYDRVRDTVLATATTAPSAPAGCGADPAPPCLTEAQVEVLWIKNANTAPALAGFATLHAATDCANEVGTVEACYYESQLGQTIRAAKSRYPNLKQIFLSTRIYAGYASVPLNPEPYAYEYGFSAKWLIQAQVDQARNSTVDPVAGDVSYTSGIAAWTAWGPYLWADGTTPRSDGLVWCGGQSGSPCNGTDDFQSDGTHPSAETGVPKVVNLMMQFFLNSVYTPWFRP